MALVGNDGASNFLYAADFHNRKVDVFDAGFHKVTVSGGFTDSALPAGYAPFGIQAVTSAGTTSIYVAYAMTQAGSDDEADGAGLGLVNVFDTHGVLKTHLVPAGGKLGDDVEVRFLGDPAGATKQKFKLPAKSEAKFGLFAQDANGISPSPVPAQRTLTSSGEGASAVTVPSGEGVTVDAYLPALAGISHVARVRSPLIGVQLWPPLVVFQTPAVA